MSWRFQLVLTLVPSVLLSGCEQSNSTNSTLSENSLTYLEAKNDFALALGSAVTAEQGDMYRIVPISGPQYSIGSALDPQNPADVVTETCLVPEPPLVKWAPLPTTTFTRRVVLDGSLPPLLKKATSILMSLDANINLQTSVLWQMEDVAQRLSPQSVFIEAISDADCVKYTGQRNILFVRGIIYAKESFVSTSRSKSNISTTEMAQGLRLDVDHSGGFQVQDQASIPRYYIVTLKASESNTRTRRKPIFIPPTDEILERMGRMK